MTIYIPMQEIMWILFYLFGFASGLLATTVLMSIRNSAQQAQVEKILREQGHCIHFQETNKIPTVKNMFNHN